MRILRLAVIPMGAFVLASCGDNPGTVPAAAETEPAATVELPKKPVRVAQSPLPTPEIIAAEVVKSIGTTSKVTYYPPAPDRGFPGGARLVPDARFVLYPPTNATRLNLTFTLEADAWKFQREYKTDGVSVTIDVMNTSGTPVTTFSAEIDPTKAEPTAASATLTADIPADADHLAIAVLSRSNGALDNTTVQLSYE